MSTRYSLASIDSHDEQAYRHAVTATTETSRPDRLRGIWRPALKFTVAIEPTVVALDLVPSPDIRNLFWTSATTFDTSGYYWVLAGSVVLAIGLGTLFMYLLRDV